MKKQVDFIAAHEQEMRKYNAVEKRPPTKREWQRFELTRELAHAQESQFKKVKNEGKWHQLETVFYPILCTIAEKQGGRVELDMNEETFFGQLVYIGDDLMLGNMLCTDLIDFFAIIAVAEDMFISVVEKRFKIQFMFRLYDKIQVTDHTKKIAEIKQKIQQYDIENAINNSD